jgi:hypothetical protein
MKRRLPECDDQDTIRPMKIAHNDRNYSPADWLGMTEWFTTPLGDYLLQHERMHVQELLKLLVAAGIDAPFGGQSNQRSGLGRR